MTQRMAFVLQVRPDRIDEYVEAHRQVWPEMLDALRGGGHPELLDLPRRQRDVRLLRVRRPRGGRALPRGAGRQRRWQDTMAELLEERVPDSGPPPLQEIFRLD